MSEIKVSPVVVTQENAIHLSRSAYDDMEAAYARAEESGFVFTDAQQAAIDAALSEVSVARSHARMKKYQGQYLNATLEGRKIAFGRLSEWGLVDQAPYESEAVAKIYRFLGKAGFINTFNSTLGFPSLFGAAYTPKELQLEGVEALTQHAVELADGREIRIGLSAGDPITDIMVRNGFEPTKKTAHDVTHVPSLDQVLYTHKINPETP